VAAVTAEIEGHMAQIDEVSLALGEMKAALDFIKTELSYARVVRNEIATQVQNLGVVSNEVEALKLEVKALEKIVGIHERWRQRGIGIVLFLSSIAAICGAALTIVLHKVFGIPR